MPSPALSSSWPLALSFLIVASGALPEDGPQGHNFSGNHFPILTIMVAGGANYRPPVDCSGRAPEPTFWQSSGEIAEPLPDFDHHGRGWRRLSTSGRLLRQSAGAYVLAVLRRHRTTASRSRPSWSREATVIDLRSIAPAERRSLRTSALPAAR